MPELAEVEYFRRRWNAGMGKKILTVKIHGEKRIFRGNDVKMLVEALTVAKLASSEARGKQMLFRFTGGAWLGIHLGMTGELRAEPAGYQPASHDHLVLVQQRHSLVFRDPRLFGRVLFHQGKSEPEWWSALSPSIVSAKFSFEHMWSFLQRRKGAPIKAVLLQQDGFPGIGNWMADEILWRTGIDPASRTGRIEQRKARSLWRNIRWVSRHALRIVSKDYADPPASWLFRHRWSKGGKCPKDGTNLDRATVGGRTTAWCAKCQPLLR